MKVKKRCNSCNAGDRGLSAPGSRPPPPRRRPAVAPPPPTRRARASHDSHAPPAG
ncbi:hypothetical protein JYU34_007311 [Plutella xylostella]|uniref:Uncharacterized protein n=1 Tax=Plutella xylostella TaxID=51655 RepID=A0ABQ7QQ80_PLUXY|nr:hypothetical protein JYU34_007311 [Plutella xylostella]